MVIAATQELKLRKEGLSIDPQGAGLACYCKQPDGSDSSRKRIIVATLAGFCAEERFCEENCYRPPNPARSSDWQEAASLIDDISDENLSKGSAAETWNELHGRSKQLVEQRWDIIKALATALLAKDSEPLKPLRSGCKWSDEATAKCVTGDEAVSLLERFGIPARCGTDC
jgi:hypothetical protein